MSEATSETLTQQASEKANESAASVGETNSDQDETVRACIADALGLETSEVTLGANLMDDLDADSLAFLDIVFKLEQAFDIEITRGEMERAARGDMSEDDFAPSGVISEAGLERLRSLLPESANKIVIGLRPNQILGLFTVGTFSQIVGGKLTGAAV